MTVMNPETGIPFCDASAWYLIADLLESGHAMQPVKMKKPPGALGYELEVCLPATARRLYIKVALASRGQVHGRSFHYSESK